MLPVEQQQQQQEPQILVNEERWMHLVGVNEDYDAVTEEFIEEDNIIDISDDEGDIIIISDEDETTPPPAQRLDIDDDEDDDDEYEYIPHHRKRPRFN